MIVLLDEENKLIIGILTLQRMDIEPNNECIASFGG